MSGVAYSAAKAREWTTRRNDALRAARREGASLRVLAEQSGLSVEGVRRIVMDPAR